MRCFIVDDSEEFLASASRLLRSQGVEVIACATSSDEARVLARTLGADVALVDIELGDEDGMALADELVTLAPSTHVVLISSYERDELRELIAQTTTVGFLPKRALAAAAIERLVH
jgi:DNA-binding NarL/FixJ family response regulator